MKYYINNIGLTKHQSQAAKANITEATATMEKVVNAINGSALSADEKANMVRDYAFGRITAAEVIAITAPEPETAEEPADTTAATVTAEPKSDISRIRKAVATLANRINRKL